VGSIPTECTNDHKENPRKPIGRSLLIWEGKKKNKRKQKKAKENKRKKESGWRVDSAPS
jgi:hypothetical protein